MRISIAQFNPVVGDLKENAREIIKYSRLAAQHGSHLIVFPELALTGYPPEDLLLKPAFLRDARHQLQWIAKNIRGVAAIVGTAEEENGRRYNAAAWIERGKIKAVHRKRFLPNYGVFDEMRYFSPGNRFRCVPFLGRRVAMTVCEDLWVHPSQLTELKRARPDVVINISASPFHAGKIKLRQKIIGGIARHLRTPVLYCNMVGGQDELVFDGGSFVLLPNGRAGAVCPQFRTGLFQLDLRTEGSRPSLGYRWPSYPELSSLEQIHEALLMGLRDYVAKNGFRTVTMGISGGIDSALVAALAVEALGPNRVVGVTMPSQFNSKETRGDAARLARNLGIPMLTVPIRNIFGSFLKELRPHFRGTKPGMAEENLQARIRGALLMALSNKFGWLVLTTGNKSETSTGYSTLYGDTAGGFAVIKDVLKTTVNALARLINQRMGRPWIPESIIVRPPTAELKANQRDEDSLGPYRDLDPIIVDYIEKNRSLKEIGGSSPARQKYASKIISLIDRSEYKRRQAPPGIKITPRSFGRDHRMPITNRYRSDSR